MCEHLAKRPQRPCGCPDRGSFDKTRTRENMDRLVGAADRVNEIKQGRQLLEECQTGARRVLRGAPVDHVHTPYGPWKLGWPDAGVCDYPAFIFENIAAGLVPVLARFPILPEQHRGIQQPAGSVVRKGSHEYMEKRDLVRGRGG